MKKSLQLTVGSPPDPMASVIRAGWQKRGRHSFGLSTINSQLSTGFTLIETLLAVSLLCIAITAPMLLTVQALDAAVYARDEITAYYLAQEAIESVHQIRDGQVLKIAEAVDPSGDLFGVIPADVDFTIDATNDLIANCTGTCKPVQINPAGTVYGYAAGHIGTWTNTNFIRTVHACYIQPKPAPPNTCNSTVSNEVRIKVTVSWRSGNITPPPFTISEDLYRWVPDGSGV